MGNQLLRPTESELFSGFNDDQLSYLKDKFQILCDQDNFLSQEKISLELQMSREEAHRVMKYIDFDGEGKIDLYEFVCAAASLYQNDAEARLFIYEIYNDGKELDEHSFHLIFGTIFKYLKSLCKIDDSYIPEIGRAKFKKYDFNHNGTISFNEFEDMLQNDFHCRLWMETLGFAQMKPVELVEKPLNHQISDFELKEEDGDQFGSTPAWLKVCDQMAPAEKGKQENKAPSINLQIGYIYGYRSYDTRNNLKYSSNGEIVYHTAACGIVLNKTKNTMRINDTHNDDITCLDICNSKNLVVTGEMGRKPSIAVWDTTSMETKQIFSDKLENSIANVCISKSGRFVAASSMSDTHDIAVYDLNHGSLIAAGRGPRSVIFALKFTSTEDELVCACDKEVVFIRFASGKLESRKGVFGKAPLYPSLSIALLEDDVVTSMSNGLLIRWRGNSCSRVYKEHSKSVNALCERSEGGIISGDSEGNIIVWSNGMAKEKEISLERLLAPIKSNNIKIIALHENPNGILVGTRGGQIIEVSKGSVANILMEGHYDKELWGVCVASTKQQFFTGGEDRLLIKWDMNKRKMLLKKKMDYPIKSLDLSRANVLAVGQKNGVVNLLEATTFNSLKKISINKNPDKEVLSTVKFSPDGNILAVGYCPPISRVYLYDANTGNKLAECKGAATRVFSIDFSMGGECLLATSDEPLFYKTNGSQVTAVSSLKGEQWASMSSRFTWFTRGIWPPCSNGLDVNCVDRSSSRKYLATADDFSKVKVFKYPVSTPRQMYNECKGHSSHVTGVKWSYDDRYCISIGGLQKSVIQWAVDEQPEMNYHIEEPIQAPQAKEEQEEEYQFGDEAEQAEGEVGLEVDEGDNALCVKPYLGQVKAMTPSGYQATHRNQPPAQDLVVEQVWGVRNQYINDKVRNQLRYNADGTSCLFITAALGVQMNLKDRKQSFYQKQSDDLISFSISRDKKYCATGQMAQLNKNKPLQKIVDVHVWDVETKSLKMKLSKFHQRAVVIVEFSPSGKKLLTIGQDDKNSLAVYDWEINRLAWSSPVDGAKVTGAAWKSETEYMTVGLKHMKAWDKSNGRMCSIPGKWDPMLSVVYWNNSFVSGGSSGSVYLSGTPTKGHDGAVDCLAVDNNGVLFSGCSKGSIVCWKLAGGKLVMEKKVVDMSKIDRFDGGVLSMDFWKDKILVCTNSSSIHEVSRKGDDVTTVLESHYQGQLWAESWSPDGLRFVSAGDDCTIRIYDCKTARLLHFKKMKDRVRGIHWETSQGEMIVVGDYKGKIYLYDEQLNLLSEARTKFSKTKPRKEPFWIQDIKFSPDGKFVAFGAHGGASHVQIFPVAEKKFGDKSIVINNPFTSALLSIDWSQGSDMLMGVSQAYELQFMNLGKVVSASSVKNVKWATWSAKFGFGVNEIHQDVDYSKLNAVCLSPSRTIIATGSDDQQVRLFTYPVTIPKQKSKSYVAHSSHVTRVLFSADQQYLLSTGGNDRTIILWHVIGGPEQQQPKQEVEEEAEEEEVEDVDDNDEVEIPKAREEKVKAELKTEADDFQMDEDEGDQFMAVKPWIGAIKEPTEAYYKSNGKAPKARLSLEYAHGYRTKDCRNNLKYLSPHRIAYHTAGLGIIMELEGSLKKQTFFDLHTDDIISMAFSANRSEVLTSEMGAKPMIYRWNAEGEMVKSYKGAKKGVSAVAMNERYVVGAGLDDDHYLYLFDKDKGGLLTSGKSGRDTIIAIKWVTENNFVSIGLKHYRMWDVSGKALNAKTGVFGKNSNLLCCVEVLNGKIFTGAANGEVQSWLETSCTKAVKHHNGAVNAICIHGDLLLTGSNDFKLCILKAESLDKVLVIDCGRLLAKRSVNCCLRAIDAIDSKILIGTFGSQIFELQCKQSKIVDVEGTAEFKLVGNHMNGHYAPNSVTNQVWGLCLYQQSYMSCADDGTLRMWDIEKMEQVACIDLKFDVKLKPMEIKAKQLPNSVKGRCLAVSNSGYIVVGCLDGTVRILNDKMEPKYCKPISKKEISHVKFSPDGSLLAIGSHDCRIYIFEWDEDDNTIKLKSQSIKHNSYIKHFDFSRDGNYLHSTCGAYELLFWETHTSKQVTGGATMTRNEEWHTWNVTLGWPVQGIWEPCMDGTDINAIDRTHLAAQNGMRLLASGDDRGKVRLLQYPCVLKNSESVSGRGHSSHVTNVLFSLDDNRLFSSGGEDQTILQWRVEQ